MNIHLIRHGNMAGDPNAHLSPPVSGCLSDTGREQVERLAEALAEIPLTHIVSSPLGRALQTAQALAEPRGLDIRVEPWLEEWRPASITEDETRTRYESIVLRSGELPPEQSWKTADGESLMQMADRMIPGLLTLLAGHGVEARHGGFRVPETCTDRIAVVAHGGTLNVLMMYLMGVPLRPGHPFRFEETGMATVHFDRRLDVSYPTLILAPPVPPGDTP